jgi:hypothetical protein
VLVPLRADKSLAVTERVYRTPVWTPIGAGDVRSLFYTRVTFYASSTSRQFHSIAAGPAVASGKALLFDESSFSSRLLAPVGSFRRDFCSAASSAFSRRDGLVLFYCPQAVARVYPCLPRGRAVRRMGSALLFSYPVADFALGRAVHVPSARMLVNRA